MRYVSASEREEAERAFPCATEAEKPRLFAIIEAHRLGRTHPDEPGEAERSIARERARKKHAVEQMADRKRRQMERYRHTAEKQRKESE